LYFYFLFFILFLFGVLNQAVRAVSKKRLKPLMLDIPFKKKIKFLTSRISI
jgi:hypothetical protein